MPHEVVPDFVQGPFFGWYDGLSSSSVANAQSYIYEVIEDEGPFDGVLGLSQGASLAISLLLHHEIRHPNEPPPFCFAVLINPLIAVSPDPNFNSEYIAKYSKFYKNDEKTEPVNKGNLKKSDRIEIEDGSEVVETTPQDQAQLSRKKVPKHRSMLVLPSQRQALVNELVDLVRDVASMDPTPEKYKENWAAEKPEDFPRIFHPLTVKQRVHIPTVHVQGKYDPMIRHAALAAKLCDKKRSKIVTLEGGHSGPSTFSDHRAVAKAIEWAMKNSLQT